MEIGLTISFVAFVPPYTSYRSISNDTSNLPVTMTDHFEVLSHALATNTVTPSIATTTHSPPSFHIAKTSQPYFPIMKLPVELRLKIYDFALQDTVDSVVSPPFNTLKKAGRSLRPPLEDLYLGTRTLGYAKCPPIVGALALLHTNRAIRSETADTMNWLGVAHFRALEARRNKHNCLSDEFRLTRIPKFLTFKESIEREFLIQLEMAEDQEVVREICRVIHCATVFEEASRQKGKQ